MEQVNSSSSQRICPSCNVSTDESVLSRSDYRCPGCNFEMAHVDTAPNGSVRGVFGFVMTEGAMVQDRYVIRRVLGKGGFGATYLVEDHKLKGKRRALKEIPALLYDEHEVNLLSQLNHPSIPDIIDRFESNGMIYLILEFGGSHTLGSECKRLGGRIPLNKLTPLMRQLCDALEYLHLQDPPIIHRDLKPDNILLDENGRVMLIDFGIAKESNEGTTRMMARAASHGFSPPEQVLGTGTDERSDIYSFGATLYYMLTGRIPEAAHERVAGKDLVLPSMLVPGLPPELDEMLLGTMSLNLNQRPPKIAHLKAMLDVMDSLVVHDVPGTAQTVRLGSTSPGASTPRPGRTSGTGGVPGIRIMTSETIAPRSATGETAPKNKKLVSTLTVVSILVIAVACVGYFVFSGKKTETPKPEAKTTAPAQTPPSQPTVGKESVAAPVKPGGLPRQPASSLPVAKESVAVPTQPAVLPVPPPEVASGAPPQSSPPADVAAITPAQTPATVAPAPEASSPVAAVSPPAPAPPMPAMGPSPPPPGSFAHPGGGEPFPAHGQDYRVPSSGASAEDLLKQRRSEKTADAEPEEKTERSGGVKPSRAGASSGKGGAPPPARKF